MAKKSYTTKQVMGGFAVSDMTIFTWRKGTANRAILPHTVEGRSVTFPAAEVKAWAKACGLPFDVSKAEAPVDAQSEKPGPKKTTVVPAKKAMPKMATKKAVPAPARKKAAVAQASA